MSSDGSSITAPDNPSRQSVSTTASTQRVTQSMSPNTGSFAISSLSRLAAHSNYKPARSSPARSKRPTTTLLDYVSKRPKSFTSTFAQARTQTTNTEVTEEGDEDEYPAEHYDDARSEHEEDVSERENETQQNRNEEPIHLEEEMQTDLAAEEMTHDEHDEHDDDTMQLDQDSVAEDAHGSQEDAEQDNEAFLEDEVEPKAQAPMVSTPRGSKRSAWYTGEANPVLGRVSMARLTRTPREPSREKPSIPEDVLRSLENASISNVQDPSRAETALSRVIQKQDFERMQVLGQFNLGFIVAALDDHDLFVIDQHASDEKYNFETLQATTIIQGQRLFQQVSLTGDTLAMCANFTQSSEPGINGGRRARRTGPYGHPSCQWI